MAKYARISLKHIHDVSDHHDGKLRLVEIGETVSCNCSFAAKRDLCLHAVWVLVNVLGVKENDDVLHQ